MPGCLKKVFLSGVLGLVAGTTADAAVQVKVENVPHNGCEVVFNRTPVSSRLASYAKGERPQFRITATELGTAVTNRMVEVSVEVPGDWRKKTTPVKLDAKGEAILTVECPDRPGWVFVTDGLPVTRSSAGAMYDGENIRASASAPDDFRAFWDAEIAALGKLPIQAKLTEVEAQKSLKDKVRTWEFEVTCTGPRPTTGYISMPIGAKPKSLPLYVGFNGAGDVSAYRSDHYGEVAIAIQVNKFGIPNGLDEKGYREKGYNASDIDNYPTRGIDDPKNAMYKWIIVRHLRAVQWGKSVPEWSGKDLILNGESFGGGQVLIVGALDPDVTFVCSCVPACCDHNGRLVGRTNGYPHFWEYDANGQVPTDKRKWLETLRYFDTVNFCALYRPGQEVTIGTGFRDTLCNPDGVIAAYHNIPAGVKKTLWLNPIAGHDAGNWNGGHRLYELLGKW